MAVKIGPREIIASGAVIAAGNEPVRVQLEGLDVVIVFSSGEGEHTAAWTASEGTLTVTLTNWDNPLGVGFDRRIGVNGAGLPIVMALFVHTIGPEGDRIRLVNYNFSVGEVRK
jgi:hypothetical protein